MLLQSGINSHIFIVKFKIPLNRIYHFCVTFSSSDLKRKDEDLRFFMFSREIGQLLQWQDGQSSVRAPDCLFNSTFESGIEYIQIHYMHFYF